jgi:Putative adhesin
MILRPTLLAASLFLSSAGAFAMGQDADFDRSLTVHGAPSVSIESSAGHIRVVSSGGGEIHVTGHIHVRRDWPDAGAEARVKQILANPPIEQAGNTVTIGSDHGDSGLYRNITIDYDVTMPKTGTLKARTGSGAVEVTGIDGPVSAETGSGEVQVQDVGPNARLNTGSGSIHASGVRGAAELRTGSGDVQLSVSAGGDVTAETGSGTIRIAGVEGGLRARTGSGSIEAAGNPTSDWRLETGSGSVRLALAGNAHFNLDAGSGSVRIDRPIMMQGALDKHHVSGAVNGGGPTVHASTGSGGIDIH